ncbi:MAG: prepilin-type N-terminal cleavage/methylation domain-containing protein [Desulfosarcinaceae bacterium]|nr:prepilin-type N-terminal cleavage/methylation domain-containing protein [Desulfosarcinaceae bacterium]
MLKPQSAINPSGDGPLPLGRQLGFTLFEVILVLLIVTLLTAIVISRNSQSATRAKLQGQANLLKTQLRYAQARALNANQIWGMTALNNSVWLFNGGSTANQIQLPGEASSPVVFGAGDRQDLAVTNFTVSFDDRGQPCTGDTGTTPIASALAITVSDTGSGASTQIVITPNTGFIQ